MSNVAHLPIVADRYGACVRQIHVAGLDLTGVDMRAQVRMGGDVPGAPLVDLRKVTNGNAEGLRLVEVTRTAGLPTSHVELVVNESTMEALPYAGELGDETQLAWDWQITLSGRKQRVAKGAFIVTGDGVTGADLAPTNRASGWCNTRRTSGGMRTGATLTFGDDVALVSIDGADLLAPEVARAASAADAAVASRTAAKTAADQASLSAFTALTAAKLYPTTAAGLAATAAEGYFTVVGDGTATYAILYRKTNGAAVEQARYASKAAYEGPAGASLIGMRPRGGGPALALNGFLDRFGYWAEDRAGIQQANDLIVASGVRGQINLPPGATIPANAGVKIDGSFVGFEARGATIDASAMGAGAVITMTGSSDPPYRQSMQTLRLPRLIGPGQGSAVDGVLFHFEGTGGHHGPSHLRATGLNIEGFRNGIVFRNRGYLIRIYDSDISDCRWCVWQDDAEDGQENNRLEGCTLYNSQWAVRTSSSKCDLFLVGCSLDALLRLYQGDSGTLNLIDSHVEVVGTTVYTDTPIVLASEFSRMIWRGGSRRVPLATARPFPYWASLAAGSEMVDEVAEALSDRSGTGAFATGAGTLLRPGRIAGVETRDNCFVAHEARSRVVDPTFATMLSANTLSVAPSGAGYSQPTRYSERQADNDSSSLALDNGRLAHGKAFGSGAPASFRLILPVQPQELIGGRIFFEKFDGSSGTMTLDASWGALDPVANGNLPNLTRLQSYASQSVTLPNIAVGATPAVFSPLGSHRAPAWANCWVLTVNRLSMTAGRMHFSNPNFDRVG